MFVAVPSDSSVRSPSSVNNGVSSIDFTDTATLAQDAITFFESAE